MRRGVNAGADQPDERPHRPGSDKKDERQASPPASTFEPLRFGPRGIARLGYVWRSPIDEDSFWIGWAPTRGRARRALSRLRSATSPEAAAAHDEGDEGLRGRHG
jgi:hypothetical protein